MITHSKLDTIDKVSVQVGRHVAHLGQYPPTYRLRLSTFSPDIDCGVGLTRDQLTMVRDAISVVLDGSDGLDEPAAEVTP